MSDRIELTSETLRDFLFFHIFVRGVPEAPGVDVNELEKTARSYFDGAYTPDIFNQALEEGLRRRIIYENQENETRYLKIS
ncbi:hypothetical protein COU59_03605 [Candidatus Pacearchaeota archaeon CG10_big_fil_rev_8_21_14_0_10_34_12]|nr:MAG: hypothetical protein COU59_03605 [Candidatus Pacearchaeota archaeon CG10_big_fil_rev_8_21_14_0_10_34_12]